MMAHENDLLAPSFLLRRRVGTIALVGRVAIAIVALSTLGRASAQQSTSGTVESVVLEFAFDSTEITVETATKINDLASSNGPLAVYSVVGHADSTGPSPYNIWLSLERAEAVLALMKRASVPATGATVLGVGEDAPIADNALLAGRRQNRRVDIRFTRNSGAVTLHDGCVEGSREWCGSPSSKDCLSTHVNRCLALSEGTVLHEDYRPYVEVPLEDDGSIQQPKIEDFFGGMTVCELRDRIYANAASAEAGMVKALDREILAAQSEQFHRREARESVLQGWRDGRECPRKSVEYGDPKYEAAFPWEPEFPKVCVERREIWIDSSYNGRVKAAEAGKLSAFKMKSGMENAAVREPGEGCGDGSSFLNDVLGIVIKATSVLSAIQGIPETAMRTLLEEAGIPDPRVIFTKFQGAVRKSLPWLPEELIPGPGETPLSRLTDVIEDAIINLIFGSGEIEPEGGADEFFASYREHTDEFGQITDEARKPGSEWAKGGQNGQRHAAEFLRAIIRHGLLTDDRVSDIKRVYLETETDGLMIRKPNREGGQQAWDNILAALYVDSELITGYAGRYLTYGLQSPAIRRYDVRQDRLDNKGKPDSYFKDSEFHYKLLSFRGPIPWVFNTMTPRMFTDSAYMERYPNINVLAKAISGATPPPGEWKTVHAWILDSAQSREQDGKVLGWFQVMISAKYDPTPEGRAARELWAAMLHKHYGGGGIGEVLGRYFDSGASHPSHKYLKGEFGGVTLAGAQSSGDVARSLVNQLRSLRRMRAW